MFKTVLVPKSIMDPQSVEAGEAYLNSMGFRSLIEWMTAEVLLSRPDDPLKFFQALLQEKIGERKSGENFHCEHTQAYLRQCYAAASASADDNGRIVIRPRKFASSSSINNVPTVKPGNDSALFRRLSKMEQVIKACRIIGSELDPTEATKIIIKQACAVLNAERATLFIYERATNMLVLKVSEGATDIQVPFGKGVAGTVAATGKAMNIADAYADPNFDSQYDHRNGYQTRSMLCVPVLNGANNIVGVMQVLNKISVDRKARFCDEDEEILTSLAAHAGVALHNADTHALACIARQRVKEVLSIVQDMHRDLGFISLMFAISTGIQKFVNSDRCTLYIVDHAKNELWTLQGELNIRVPLNQGIAGAVAMNNETVNLANAYDDPRFNKEFDQRHGYRTRSVLAMPLRNAMGDVIAVVQLINKLDISGEFSKDDEELLGTFLQIAGPILFTSHSHLTLSLPQAKGDQVTEFTGKSTRETQESVEMNVISEGDENEA
ncbi:Cyclic nucleotide phosphodiesterase [Plasmopara halstedii]|uniref:Cyclic nucleotide phosphodiesterase n=1 Tax=Plasmopara halstedii TaxID=4781 RepID=A0A0P1A616_PLAHL|nr:Cyclic nucleotide phosphodiesterase [Plasmopara halstedii]CEG36038.1 Cyclic nucleotide phosphodiesterase [Plasmopara halstedii]|eukprot:XP_024572407.1 Cyclic nucleotide phosphodiesterase [Plasmopara halstedii]